MAFDNKCLGMTVNSLSTLDKSCWHCPKCKSKIATSNSDASPARPKSPGTKNVQQRKAADKNTEKSKVKSGAKQGLPQFQNSSQDPQDSTEGNNSVAKELRLLREEISKLSTELACNAKKHEEEIVKLTSLISTKDKEIMELRADLQMLKRQSHQQSKDLLSNHLEIIGLPETPNESPVHIAMLAARQVGVSLELSEIDWASRAGNKLLNSTSNLPRPLIVRLIRRSKRNDILRAAKQRKNQTSKQLTDGPEQNVYINERLTKETRLLFREARKQAKLFNYKYCWCKNNNGHLLR